MSRFDRDQHTSAANDGSHAPTGDVARSMRSSRSTCPPGGLAATTHLSGRFARYTGGSLIAFAASEATFVATYASGLVGTTGATLLAFVAGAVPNYLLNRRWVWKRRGSVDVSREIMLYAVVSAVSLLCASAATAWATHAVVGNHATATIAAASTYFVVYGLLFVAKFIVFEKFVFTGSNTSIMVRPRPPAWMSDRSRLLAVTLAVGVAATAAWWAASEHSVPGWDGAQYLDTAWRVAQATRSNGITGLVHATYAVAPGRAPLFPLTIVPFTELFGSSAGGALAMNVVLWPVLLFATGAIAVHLFGSRTRLLAMFLVATTPLVVGLSHEVLQEFVLITLVALSVYLMLCTRGFSRTPSSLALGAVLGLGMLTKVTFPIFVVGPLIVVIAIDARGTRGASAGSNEEHRLRSTRVTHNLLGTSAIALTLTALWYLPNWQATIDYVALNTSDTRATVGVHHSLQDLTVAILNDAMSWGYAAIGIIAVSLQLPRLARLVAARSDRRYQLRGPLILGAWIGLPLLAVAVGQLQNPRYLAAGTPALAVALAGALNHLPWRAARATLTTLAIGVGLVQGAVLALPGGIGGLPDAITLTTPLASASVTLARRPAGTTLVPDNVDYATPIIRYLERTSGYPQGHAGALTIGLLQTQVVTNVATLSFVADLRHDSFVFRRQFVDPDHAAQLSAMLSAYDYVLFIPEHELDTSTGPRASALNHQYYATHYMTPRLLGLFAVKPASFRVGALQTVQVLQPNRQHSD